MHSLRVLESMFRHARMSQLGNLYRIKRIVFKLLIFVLVHSQEIVENVVS